MTHLSMFKQNNKLDLGELNYKNERSLQTSNKSQLKKLCWIIIVAFLCAATIITLTLLAALQWPNLIHSLHLQPNTNSAFQEEIDRDNNDTWTNGFVQNLIDQTAGDLRKSNDEKGHFLNDELRKLGTSDAYHIFVYNDSDDNEQLHHIVYDDESNVLTANRKAKTNILVYRSREMGRLLKSDDYSRFRNAARGSDTVRRFESSKEGYRRMALRLKWSIKDAALVSVISNRLQPAIYGTSIYNHGAAFTTTGMAEKADGSFDEVQITVGYV